LEILRVIDEVVLRIFNPNPKALSGFAVNAIIPAAK
jgi:hypothetical protein